LTPDALLPALIKDHNLDLFLTTIECDGLKGTLGGFIDTFRAYFRREPLEFIRLVEDLLNKGTFEFRPVDEATFVLKVLEWRDVRDRKNEPYEAREAL